MCSLLPFKSFFSFTYAIYRMHPAYYKRKDLEKIVMQCLEIDDAYIIKRSRYIYHAMQK